jgi:N-acylneuraminate cytidylyltransferase
VNKHKLGKIENDVFKPFTYIPGQRSQDLKTYYYENGLIYITRSDVILENETVLGEKVKPIIVDGPFSDVDIDTKEDFDWAEFIGNKYIN